MQQLVSILEARGYFVTVKRDMQEFYSLRTSTPDRQFIAPTFDPALSDDDGFGSIHITDRDGSLAGLIAWRSMQTEDFLEDVRTGRIWYKDPQFEPLSIQAIYPVISGKVCYRGGLYVYPEHRKTGLSSFLTRLVRQIAIVDESEWILGHALGYITERELQFSLYGYTRVYPCLEGDVPIPFTGTFEPFHLLTCKRPEFMDQARRERAALVLAGNKDLATIASELHRVAQPEEQRFSLCG